jgi:hypothetical protein
MEDNLKISELEYISYHWSDLTKMLNANINNQTDYMNASNDVRQLRKLKKWNVSITIV